MRENKVSTPGTNYILPGRSIVPEFIQRENKQAPFRNTCCIKGNQRSTLSKRMLSKRQQTRTVSKHMLFHRQQRSTLSKHMLSQW